MLFYEQPVLRRRVGGYAFCSPCRCEDGLLVIPFQPVAPQRQVLRVPQVFHMGDDPCDDAPETTDAKASKSEVVSVTSFAPWHGRLALQGGLLH